MAPVVSDVYFNDLIFNGRNYSITDNQSLYIRIKTALSQGNKNTRLLRTGVG